MALINNGLGDAFDNIMRENTRQTVVRQKAASAAKFRGVPPVTTSLDSITRKRFGFAPFAVPDAAPSPLALAVRELVKPVALTVSAAAPPSTPANPSGSTPAAAASAAASLPSGGGGGGGGGGGYVDDTQGVGEVADTSLMGRFNALPGLAKVAILGGAAGAVYGIYRLMSRGGSTGAGKS